MAGVGPSTRMDLADALAMQVQRPADGPTTVRAHVHDGFDVFGIPHGGYLAAVAARAVLLASDQPDLFTITVHYLRKAVMGSVDLQVTRLGGSRRFGSWHAVASQDGRIVLTALASVGDRTGIDGPSWTDQRAWDPHSEPLSAPAGDPDLPFSTPPVAAQLGERLALASAPFVVGQRGDHATLRATVEAARSDQLTAIVACDITPPAVWNVLGRKGWVPTVELTVHVRARPSAGPLSIEVATHHVQDGFLEEDALVRDAGGRLVAQSRQLARWTTE